MRRNSSPFTGSGREAPAGVYGRQFCPSQDKTEAVCLWEADSLEAIQDYLDSLIGQASENAYFQVGTDHTIGIPVPIMSADRS